MRQVLDDTRERCHIERQAQVVRWRALAILSTLKESLTNGPDDVQRFDGYPLIRVLDTDHRKRGDDQDGLRH